MSDRPRSLKITIVMPHSIGGANSGDRARTRALADELRTLGHNVAIVAPSWDVMRGDVKLVGDEYLVGQSRTGFAKVIWRASLALRRLYDPNALHHSGHLRSSLGKVVAELMPDVVDVQHSYWHIDVAAPTVVTVHNVLANPSFDSRSRAQRRVRNRYESKALRDGDVIVVFSNQEFDRLTAAHHISDDDISIVEIGHPATIADRSPQAPPEHALFVGSIDYGPNRDAAQRLVRLWDKEGVHLPPLYIVGRRASVLGETSNTKVQIVSDAPELKSYYDTAIAALMPLNHGGGVRLKALEAMAWRVPIVGTALAVEGLGLDPDVSYIEITSEEDIPSALERLSNPEVRENLTESAAARWEVIGSPQSMTQKMVENYSRAICRHEEHRATPDGRDR